MSKEKEFKRDLELYWHSEARNHRAGELLTKALTSPLHPINLLEFRGALADAILNEQISVTEYERLTGLDFESEAEVADDLRLLWGVLFNGDPVTSTPA